MQTSIAVDADVQRMWVRATAGDRSIVETTPGLDPTRPLPAQWARAITSFMDAHPDLSVDAVAVSTIPASSASADDLLTLVAERGVRRVAVAPDGATAYLGALGAAQGAVIYAGTYTVCFACGPGGAAQVDGWGPIFGNAGSGFWIGRNAIEAGLRGQDGRRQLTALTELVFRDFPGLASGNYDLQATPGFVQRIADFAARVNALAGSDRVAANILDKAAAHLSEAVQAAIRRAGLSSPEPPHVVAVGPVFDSDRVRRRFCDYLTLHWPTFALTESAGDQLDGADALLSLSAEHPLFARVSFAER